MWQYLTIYFRNKFVNFSPCKQINKISFSVTVLGPSVVMSNYKSFEWLQSLVLISFHSNMLSAWLHRNCRKLFAIRTISQTDWSHGVIWPFSFLQVKKVFHVNYCNIVELFLFWICGSTTKWFPPILHQYLFSADSVTW